MQIPPAFMTFTHFFHQDVDVLFPEGKGLIEDAIANTPQNDLVIIKQFLDELTSGKYSETQLRSIWRDTNAEISPFRGNEGSCTDFLMELTSHFS